MPDGVLHKQSITETTEAARREFFKKVEKLTLSHHKISRMQDLADQAAQEYQKLFGRIGVHPLLHLKDGKKRIRYILDREETWVLYKPALWQMGGKPAGGKGWEEKVSQLAAKVARREDGQKQMLKSEQNECVQEWHGLTQGLAFIDAEQPVKDWGFVQRLDVETDGPVVVAKTWRAQRAILVQMQQHVFSKAYMCLVHGRVENKIHYVKQKFAPIGQDGNTCVMLQYNADCDPFYEMTEQGKFDRRGTKPSETMYKPLAYYHRKEDNTDYSLVYVNILSGITHQVRITMQSAGHPLVSDDRYLPKDQAVSDLRWCPRNFLTEVRADWFDIGGPYKDEKRRRYQRVSMENPLPKIFQQVLEERLKLVDKLDPTADLYVGCEYWALGDEQLMNAFPKDAEYRRKVLRWGQRQGIHLDALDRLLMLDKQEIDMILNQYKGPESRDDEYWICPLCMAWNAPDLYRPENDGKCRGLVGVRGCEGKPLNDDRDLKTPKGWRSWIDDPTLHLLMIVNHHWLEARRRILKAPRASWEKPPTEAVGSPATEETLMILEAALFLNLKAGGRGILEDELHEVPGLEHLVLPLGAPPEDSNVNRCRLPGTGINARWLYTLKGKDRVKHTQDYDVKAPHPTKPVEVDTAKLPERMVTTNEERERIQLEQREREKFKKEQAEQAEKKKKEKEEQEMNKKKREREEKKAEAAESAKRPRIWKKLESTSNPGNFYFLDAESGKSTSVQPVDFVDTGPAWERIESKSVQGEFYYFNQETGQSRMDRPRGEIKNDGPDGIVWQRKESTSNPGSFYYVNTATNASEADPPTVNPPWKLCESTSKKGQFYYFHEGTQQTVMDPPLCARAAPAGSAAPRPAQADSSRSATQANPDQLPSGWRKQSSDKYPGKFYYVQDSTNKTVWERPEVWDKKRSESTGKYYFVNVDTGETKWET